jgi:conjugal transfer pilus assembly protein TraA
MNLPTLGVLVDALVSRSARRSRAGYNTGPIARRSHASAMWAVVASFSLCALLSPTLSLAGNGGTEFASAYTTITTWLQGDLGRLIAVSLLIVGLIAGVIRQSIMAAVPAIACGLVATVAPTIIGAVVTASL